MQPIRIPGVGNIQIDQILGAFAGFLALIGVIAGIVVGITEGEGSSNNRGETSQSTSVTPSATAPIPPVSASAPAESPRADSKFGPGKEYSWRELFSYDDRLMRLNANRLDIGMDRFLLRGGAFPSTDLENYVIGEANKFRSLQFDESVEGAKFFAISEYYDNAGPVPTLIHVARVSIPTVEAENGDPWAEIQAPELKGLRSGTAVRFDDNYFYVFSALRASDSRYF